MVHRFRGGSRFHCEVRQVPGDDGNALIDLSAQFPAAGGECGLVERRSVQRRHRGHRQHPVRAPVKLYARQRRGDSEGRLSLPGPDTAP